MEFAHQENLRAVEVPMAHTLYSYHHPYLHAPSFLPIERASELQEIRTKMESLYDATALQLGFVATADSYQWNNPYYVRQYRAPLWGCALNWGRRDNAQRSRPAALG